MEAPMQIDDVLWGQRRVLRWELIAVAVVCGLLWLVILTLVLNGAGWSVAGAVATALVVSVVVGVLFVLVGGRLYWGTPDVDIQPLTRRTVRFRNREGQPVVLRIGVFRLHGEEAGGRSRAFIWKMRPENPGAVEEIVLGPGERSKEIAAPDPFPPIKCSMPEHGLWAGLRFFGVEISRKGRYPLYLVWLEPTHAALIMGHHSRSRAWRKAVKEFHDYLEMMAELEEYAESARRREEEGGGLDAVEPDFEIEEIDDWKQWEKLLEADEEGDEEDEKGGEKGETG